jgi:predicted RNase H-like HicB family nuclease
MDVAMTFPVLIQPSNGQFAAALVGAPDVRATASTPAEALAALEKVIEQRVAKGELLTLEIGRRGVSGLAGKYRDDPTLRDICEAAYQQRDAEPVE